MTDHRHESPTSPCSTLSHCPQSSSGPILPDLSPCLAPSLSQQKQPPTKPYSAEKTSSTTQIQVSNQQKPSCSNSREQGTPLLHLDFDIPSCRGKSHPKHCDDEINLKTSRKHDESITTQLSPSFKKQSEIKDQNSTLKESKPVFLDYSSIRRKPSLKSSNLRSRKKTKEEALVKVIELPFIEFCQKQSEDSDSLNNTDDENVTTARISKLYNRKKDVRKSSFNSFHKKKILKKKRSKKDGSSSDCLVELSPKNLNSSPGSSKFGNKPKRSRKRKSINSKETSTQTDPVAPSEKHSNVPSTDYKIPTNSSRQSDDKNESKTNLNQLKKANCDIVLIHNDDVGRFNPSYNDQINVENGSNFLTNNPDDLNTKFTSLSYPSSNFPSFDPHQTDQPPSFSSVSLHISSPNYSSQRESFSTFVSSEFSDVFRLKKSSSVQSVSPDPIDESCYSSAESILSVSSSSYESTTQVNQLSLGHSAKNSPFKKKTEIQIHLHQSGAGSNIKHENIKTHISSNHSKTNYAQVPSTSTGVYNNPIQELAMQPENFESIVKHSNHPFPFTEVTFNYDENCKLNIRQNESPKDDFSRINHHIQSRCGSKETDAYAEASKKLSSSSFCTGPSRNRVTSSESEDFELSNRITDSLLPLKYLSQLSKSSELRNFPKSSQETYADIEQSSDQSDEQDKCLHPSVVIDDNENSRTFRNKISSLFSLMCIKSPNNDLADDSSSDSEDSSDSRNTKSKILSFPCCIKDRSDVSAQNKQIYDKSEKSFRKREVTFSDSSDCNETSTYTIFSIASEADPTEEYSDKSRKTQVRCDSPIIAQPNKKRYLNRLAKGKYVNHMIKTNQISTTDKLKQRFGYGTHTIEKDFPVHENEPLILSASNVVDDQLSLRGNKIRTVLETHFESPLEKINSFDEKEDKLQEDSNVDETRPSALNDTEGDESTLDSSDLDDEVFAINTVESDNYSPSRLKTSKQENESKKENSNKLPETTNLGQYSNSSATQHSKFTGKTDKSGFTIYEKKKEIISKKLSQQMKLQMLSLRALPNDIDPEGCTSPLTLQRHLERKYTSTAKLKEDIQVLRNINRREKLSQVLYREQGQVFAKPLNLGMINQQRKNLLRIRQQLEDKEDLILQKDLEEKKAFEFQFSRSVSLKQEKEVRKIRGLRKGSIKKLARHTSLIARKPPTYEPSFSPSLQKPPVDSQSAEASPLFQDTDSVGCLSPEPSTSFVYPSQRMYSGSLKPETDTMEDQNREKLKPVEPNLASTENPTPDEKTLKRLSSLKETSSSHLYSSYSSIPSSSDQWSDRYSSLPSFIYKYHFPSPPKPPEHLRIKELPLKDDIRQRMLQKILVQKPSLQGQSSQRSKFFTNREVAPKDAQVGDDWEPSEFIENCLAAHNLYRRRHLAPPLELDMELCYMSQQWANEICHTGVVKYRALPDIGENIFCRAERKARGKYPPPPSGEEVAASWYGNVRQYRFNKDGSALAARAGPFTQMVWCGTTRFGVGMAINATTGRTIVVAHYTPSGNIGGQFQDNVKALNTRALAAEILEKQKEEILNEKMKTSKSTYSNFRQRLMSDKKENSDSDGSVSDSVGESLQGINLDRLPRGTVKGVLGAQKRNITGKNATKIFAAHLLGHASSVVLPPGEVDPKVVIYINRRGKWLSGGKKDSPFGCSVAEGISSAAMLTTMHATASAKARMPTEREKLENEERKERERLEAENARKVIEGATVKRLIPHSVSFNKEDSTIKINEENESSEDDEEESNDESDGDTISEEDEDV